MKEAKGTSALDRIVFLAVPPSLGGLLDSAAPGSFTIDPSIPIPAEPEDGEAALDLENLSWEQILSGMIRVVTLDPRHQHADYYRNFVLAVKPGIVFEFTQAAILKTRNGDYAMALEILDALLALLPHSPEVLLNRALTLEKRSDALDRAGHEEEAETAYAEARLAYDYALAGQPPFPETFFSAASFFQKRREFDRAILCLSAYISASGEGEKAAEARARLRDIEQSGLDDSMFREACLSVRRGEEEEALEEIRDFLERRPNVWNGWFVLGWALRRLSRWADAEAAFAKALELGGGGADLLNERAICLMELGDYRLARRELETALAEDPENIKIISNLGILAMKTGDEDEAAGFFRTVLDLDAADPIACQFFSRSL